MAKILIAEDDVHILRLLSIWLKRNGHEVSEANNGIQARDLYSAAPDGGFDLIVSDINMPGMSGIELAQWLRVEMKSDIPLILLSSRCDQAGMSEKLDPIGVQVHPKPFSPSRLVQEIEKRLAERHGPRSTVAADSAKAPVAMSDSDSVPD